MRLSWHARGMMAVMTAVLSGAMGSLLGSCALVREPTPRINDRLYILGPEAVRVCGGWLQVWARVDTTSFLRDVELFIKASPDAGGGWVIRNEHLLVEHAKEVVRRRRLKDIEQLELKNKVELKAPNTDTDIGKWKLQVEGLDPVTGLKVFIKPFDGCKDTKAISHVVIRARELE